MMNTRKLMACAIPVSVLTGIFGTYHAVESNGTSKTYAAVAKQFKNDTTPGMPETYKSLTRTANEARNWRNVYIGTTALDAAGGVSFSAYLALYARRRKHEVAGDLKIEDRYNPVKTVTVGPDIFEQMEAKASALYKKDVNHLSFDEAAGVISGIVRATTISDKRVVCFKDGTNINAAQDGPMVVAAYANNLAQGIHEAADNGLDILLEVTEGVDAWDAIADGRPKLAHSFYYMNDRP
jgi:hypothetical protein